MRILIASSIHQESIINLSNQHDVITAFNAPEDQLVEIIADREVIIFRSGVQISRTVMENAHNLKLLIRAGSGVDNLDINYVESQGLRLIRIPDPGGKAVAELSFAFMLALSRDLITANLLTHEGIWAKQELTGYLLNGKTLGVIGVGNIGSRVGQMGASWGMTVIGYDRNNSQEFNAKKKAMNIRMTSLEELLSFSDYVTIHTPLNEDSRYMIGKEQLALMKPGSYLINLARGGVVEESALFKALTENKNIAGVALDVHEIEGAGIKSIFSGFPNVILTPHIGAMTIDSQKEIGKRVVEIIESYNDYE